MLYLQYIENERKYAEFTQFPASVGTEELAHMEMIAAILYQLTKNLTPEEIKRSGFDTYFVDHTAGIYPVSAAGVPFTASYFAVKGDLFADLHEDLAADAAIAQKQTFNARDTYSA